MHNSSYNTNTVAILFTHYPTVWTVKCSVVGNRALAVLSRGVLEHVALNPNIHSILWSTSAGFGQVTYFLPSSRWGDYVTSVFLNHSTVLTDGCDWTNVGHTPNLIKNPIG